MEDIEDGRECSDWPELQRAVEGVRLGVAQPPSVWQRLVKKIFPLSAPHPERQKYHGGIYILIYHSVVDPDNRQYWEKFYKKGEVTAQQFRCQLEYMLAHMTPIALSQAPELLAQNRVDRPYFAITFDDGFSNNLTVADPIIQKYNLKPTVFVNGAFVRQEEVFYRVLSAIIIKNGHAPQLADRLRQLIGQHDWSDDSEELFIQMKQHYTADAMEQATAEIYNQYIGDPAQLKAHLDIDELKTLQNHGWEIANHTDAHRLLSCQKNEDAIKAIEVNGKFLQDNGIYSSDFLGFPVGRSQDVDQNIGDWLDRNPNIHGIFANNGVNTRLCRKEWLRFSLGQHISYGSLDKIIRNQIERTQKAV
ncbi:MAG: polysaccharide deacetylase family protein [Magnetococcales bacterium]|nr:polysaccharide deacetylase family protein [Magnetococcales bacterium]